MAIQYGNRTCYWRYFGKSWLSESAVNVFNAAQGQNWVMAGNRNRSRQDVVEVIQGQRKRSKVSEIS